MKTKVKAKTQPTEKQKMERAHEAVKEIHRTNAEAREAINRYLKQRGVTMDNLADQSEGFRKDCYGAIRDALQGGDWSKLTHVQRFDPLASAPAPKPEPQQPSPEPVEVVEETKVEVPAAAQKRDSTPDPAQLLEQAIGLLASRNASGFDEDRFKKLFDHEIKNGIEWDKTGVAKLIDDRIQSIPPRRIEIIIPDREKIATDRQHYQFETLLQLLSLRKNVLITGPAGSGKTTAAQKAAEILGLPFRPQSIGLQTSKGDLMGTRFPDREYIPSPLRSCYGDGGIWLADEFDAGHAGVNTIINAALANAICGFPDGTIDRHKDFVGIAAANTWGWGANDQYVGRNQLDAATLDRFIKLDWSYDEELERQTCPNTQWVDRVQAIRRGVQAVRAKMVVSPRASYNGADLLAAGMKQDLVEKLTIWNGVDSSTKEKVQANAK